ncbi:MAG TPA: hypothetical protein VGM88_15300 [Kofleriaceae bacterium]|jgi:hypothetical protein
MSAVCPACGVAVVPGYVKCPKCHTPLPYGAGRGKRSTIDPGGTAIPEKKGFPLFAAIVALAVGGAIVWAGVALSHRGRADAEPAPPPVEATPAAVVAPPEAPAPAEPAPQATPTLAPPLDPTAATNALATALRKQRLWSTVEVTGTRAIVRSASCADPQLAATIERARPTLRGGGLTRLRCVEQSGGVVFERDL